MQLGGSLALPATKPGRSKYPIWITPPMRRFHFLSTVITIVTAFALFGTAVAAERNVLFIITDDESPTLGCYGDPVAVTPAIDAVAADGLIFRNAFATTASCSASRSVVMSGLHNHRNGQFGHQHAYHKFASFHDVVSLALPRVMQRAGYRTGQIGKYHVAPEAVYHYRNLPERKRPQRGRDGGMPLANSSPIRATIGLSFCTSPPPIRIAAAATTRHPSWN